MNSYWWIFYLFLFEMKVFDFDVVCVFVLVVDFVSFMCVVDVFGII